MTPMPPNNNKKPDPSDLLKLAPLGDQNNEISNPNDKAYNQDDTSLLYTKNATLGATEVALNKVEYYDYREHSNMLSSATKIYEQEFLICS
jgi:hypothetical protein